MFVTTYLYSRQHPDAHWLWTAALPAFLLETLFYLASVFENTRVWFASAVPAFRARAGLLWISALLPYLIWALGTRTFLPNAFYLLALLSGVFVFWHVFLPRRIVYDAGFLIVAAVPLITRFFPRIYRSPDIHLLHADILGHLMWIRLGLIAILLLREWDPGPVGLWPRPREWRIGLLWFGAGIVPIVGASLAVHDVVFAPRPGSWWQIGIFGLGTFLAFLWVGTLGEDLFFMGVVERGLSRGWKSNAPAVLTSSLLFGTAHLWFRDFPDWRRALVVVLLGLFCNAAYVQSGSIRASMVTHACTVATWRMFFR